MADRLNILSLLGERSKEHAAYFAPYEKQREFVQGTAESPVAYLSAGNGCGKTAIGAYIDVCHLTGEYPEWWDGLRIEETGTYWTFSTSPKTLINGIQEQLFCEGGFYKVQQALADTTKPWPIDTHRGGKLPKRAILDIVKAPNVAKGNDYIESVTIRHASGGQNILWFGHYDLGALKMAAKHNLLYIHWDEIPPYAMYSEGLARQRTTATGVHQIITATPERNADQAMIDMLFDEQWRKSNNSRVIISIDDVPDHVIPAHNKEEAKNLTPERDKPAKLYGMPLGGSLFFETTPENFSITMAEWLDLRASRSWTALHGIDFGFNDDTGLGTLYTDTTEGITVLVKSIKRKWMSPYEFSGAARSAGFDLELPCAWPHDGLRRDKDMTTTKEGRQSKKMVSQFYREAGFKLLKQHTSRFLSEANKHAAFAEVENAAKQQRFYIVGNHNNAFAEEWRNLRITEDGRVRGDDHILDAVVCAWLNRKRGRIAQHEPVDTRPALAHRAPAQRLGVSAHLLH